MDYSTFLEISFAVNTLFCAWDNPSKKFVGQLLASVEENKKKHLQPSENVAKDREQSTEYANAVIEATVKISDRISSFENNCKKGLNIGKKVAFVAAASILLIVYFHGGHAPKLSWDSLVFALTISPAPLTWAYIYCAYCLCLCKNKKTMQKLGEQLKKNRSTYKEAVSKIIQG